MSAKQIAVLLLWPLLFMVPTNCANATNYTNADSETNKNALIEKNVLTGASPQTTSRERYGLNGPVRKVVFEETNFENTSSGRVETERRPMTTLSYDEKGNLIEDKGTEFGPFRFIAPDPLYKPEPKGKKVEVSWEQGKYIDQYGDDGHLVERTYIRHDGLVDRKIKFTYEFDSRGNWVRRVDSKSERRNGEEVFVPRGAVYRTITYY